MTQPEWKNSCIIHKNHFAHILPQKRCFSALCNDEEMVLILILLLITFVQVSLAKDTVNQDKVKDSLSMVTWNCFEIKKEGKKQRCTVGVECGCLFLCGQTICWSHMLLLLFTQKKPMTGYKSNYTVSELFTIWPLILYIWNDGDFFFNNFLWIVPFDNASKPNCCTS